MLPPLILENKPIIIVQSVNILGLFIDLFLQWDVHIFFKFITVIDAKLKLQNAKSKVK